MSNLTTHLQDISESLGFKPSSVVVENGIAKINFAQRDGSSGRLGVSLRKPLLDAGVTSDAITATADQVCIHFSQGANPARGTYPTSSGSSRLFSVQRNADGDYEMCLGQNSVRGGTVLCIGDRQSMLQELRELRNQKNDNSRTGGKANFVAGSPEWESYFDEDAPDILRDAELLKRKIKDKKADLTQTESNIEEGVALMKKSLSNQNKAGYLRARQILANADRVRSSFSRTGEKAKFATDSDHGEIGHYEVTTANRVINEFEDLYKRCSKKSSLITKQMSIIRDVIMTYARALRTKNYNLYRDAEYLSESVDRQLTASFSLTAVDKESFTTASSSRTGAKANNARPSLQEVMKSIDDYRASGASEESVRQYSETVLRAWQAESGR